MKKKSAIISTTIVMPDTHAPYVDRQAWECVLQAIEYVKPDRIVHLGDIGQWDAVNHHHFKRIRTPEPELIADRIRRDVDEVRRHIVEPLNAMCDKIGIKERIMLTGNHDIWLDRFVESNPDYAKCSFDGAEGYRFDQVIDWKKQGWKIFPCGDFFKIGKLYLYHGHFYGGVQHTKNHLVRMGASVLYGHWHDVQYSTVTHVDGPKGAWSLGCLSSLDPKSPSNQFLGRRPTNWGHAFAIVEEREGGLFTVLSVNIIQGGCSLIRHTIDGTKPRKIRRSKKLV